jgi:hypothetical protein
LQDKEHPMDLDRAKTIADVAQVVINSAKVEVDFIEAVGSSGTGFIPKEKVVEPLPGAQRIGSVK